MIRSSPLRSDRVWKVAETSLVVMVRIAQIVPSPTGNGMMRGNRIESRLNVDQIETSGRCAQTAHRPSASQVAKEPTFHPWTGNGAQMIRSDENRRRETARMAADQNVLHKE